MNHRNISNILRKRENIMNVDENFNVYEKNSSKMFKISKFINIKYFEK